MATTESAKPYNSNLTEQRTWNMNLEKLVLIVIVSISTFASLVFADTCSDLASFSDRSCRQGSIGSPCLTSGGGLGICVRANSGTNDSNGPGCSCVGSHNFPPSCSDELCSELSSFSDRSCERASVGSACASAAGVAGICARTVNSTSSSNGPGCACL